MKKYFSWMKAGLPLLIFVVLAVFLFKGLKQDPHRIPSPLIGKPLPHLKAIIGHNTKGRVALVNVFASWCVSCRAEHAVLMDIKKSHTVVLYGINYKDDRTKMRRWLAREGNPYNKIIDDPKGKLGLDLGVYGTPETFIIDRKGIVRYKYVGPISPDVWRDTLLPVIKKLRK